MLRRLLLSSLRRPASSLSPLPRVLSSHSARPKSLIEDEAELSDWVSDIKKDSFRVSLTSDDDDRQPPPRRGGGGGGRGGGRDSGGGDRGRGRDWAPPSSFRGGRGGGGGGGFDKGRRLYSDDGEGNRGRRGGGHGGFDSFSQRGGRGGGMGMRSARGLSSDGSEDDSDDFGGRPNRGRGGRGERGGRGGRMGMKSARSFSSDESEDDFRGTGHGGRGERGGRGGRMSRSFGSDDSEEDNRGDFGGRPQRGRGGFSAQRGGRGGGMSRSFGSDDSEEDSGADFGGRPQRGRGGFSAQRGGRGGRMNRSFSSESEEEDGGDFGGQGRRGRGGRGDFSNSPRGGRGRGMGMTRGRSFSSGSDEEYDFGGRGRGGNSSTLARRGGRDVYPRNGNDRGARRSLLAIPEDGDGDEDEDGDDVDDESASGFEDLDKDGTDDEQEETTNDASVERVASSELVRAKPTSTRSVRDDDSYLSQSRFDQCSISPLSLKGIKAAGFERMTVVQEATLPIILKGKDILAKAKTGTGKTVAFLLPAIEVVTKLPPVDRDNRKPPINVLVICPTRELAAQAAAEAETLLKFHPSIGVQVVTGGTRLALEQKHMQTKPCQILVATPGRLRDHTENTPGFATRLMGVKVLVLDEADRLLDMGFRKDIERIVAAVPKQRQTLLFSATVPEQVRQVCYIALKRDHEFVNTVEEGSEETHSQVKQSHIVAPLENHFPILYRILTEHISDDVDYKVIVFCTTAMVTRLVSDLLSELKLNVREIHSRKPQTYRTRISKEFRESKGLILVSSDVSARGVDYPNVTLVVQVGVPSDREQYVHRLGRTGRRGKEGQGILLLAPWERFFLESINNLPITESPLPLLDPDTKKKVERALAHVEMKSKESAYQAFLGYYNSVKKVGHDKYKLVMLANEFSRSMGLDNPPAIPKVVLGKMGLSNIPGLRSR